MEVGDGGWPPGLYRDGSTFALEIEALSFSSLCLSLGAERGFSFIPSAMTALGGSDCQDSVREGGICMQPDVHRDKLMLPRAVY